MAAVFFVTCKSEYTQLVESELAKDIRHTELPLGLQVGVSRKKYFADCWKMNKDEIISAGPGNEYAKFELIPSGTTDTFKHIKMLFYGIFDKQDIMRGLDMIMEFHTWSPWNTEYQSPVLMQTLETHYMNTYQGNSFISINVSDRIEARVKIDGNRRITMYPLSNQKVSVKIIDLLHEKDILK